MFELVMYIAVVRQDLTRPWGLFAGLETLWGRLILIQLRLVRERTGENISR